MQSRRYHVVHLFFFFLVLPFWPSFAGGLKKKSAAVASIEKHQPELIQLSDQIWAFAETALKETKSSKLLADYAEQQGFKVERGVAGMPTAFVATYGEGKPIIGVLGEFDALPGISQKASPVKEAYEAGAAGHGCGHNLFGAGSLGAAVAIKELIAAGKLKGTIRFYGTPAEESIGGKIYMARDGLFNDLDVCLAWHPDEKTKADVQSSQALVDFIVEFHGKAAHAAFDPWNGRSAVDGLELFTHGLNMLREHVKPSVRIHYTIQKGGDVPNVIPEYAKIWCWVRDSKRTGVEEVLARVREIAKGAAMMAGVESKLTIQTGDYEMLVNMAGAKLLQANLEWLGPIKYTEEEQNFARAIQRATGVEEKGLNGAIQPLEEPKPDPPGGSTDVADVSWIVPTLHVSVTTAAEGAPWHAWPVVACGGMSIGHKGMLHAAKVLAATMVDLFDDVKTREAIKAEFKEKTKGHVYKPYIPDGPPPVTTN
ncbi:MAG: amidohydrolase [candidate division KSB1 bacterium]|nr:amidohydrolase [candidate division KSB1 bacterium]MDZ7367177.1 amidohydrolase [candidate division KSB1 bacterium]MDZ7405340.1 amidohydrolase [candidate division KSB1 bacterium]